MKYLVPLFLLLGVMQLKGQLKLHASVGPQFLSGSLYTHTKPGVGVFIKAEKWADDVNYTLGIMSGYMHMSYIDDNSSAKLDLVPLLGTFTYRFLEETRVHPVIGISLGAVYLKANERTYYTSNGTTKTEAIKKILFDFTPTVGGEFDITEELGVSLNARYSFSAGSNALLLYSGIDAGAYYRFGGY